MKTYLSIMLALAAAGGGFAGGYIYSKKKYEKKVNDEIESVKKSLKEFYENPNKDDLIPKVVVPDDNTKLHKIEQKTSISETTNTTEADYYDYGKQYRSASVDKKVEAEKQASASIKKNPPYVIDVETYETSDYKAGTLFWYTDEVLTDGDGRVITNEALDIIGQDAINHLKTASGDTLYVRNETLETDFEIILEGKPFEAIPSSERVIPEEYE